jgi:hypothetical protein
MKRFNRDVVADSGASGELALGLEADLARASVRTGQEQIDFSVDWPDRCRAPGPTAWVRWIPGPAFESRRQPGLRLAPLLTATTATVAASTFAIIANGCRPQRKRPHERIGAWEVMNGRLRRGCRAWWFPGGEWSFTPSGGHPA